MLRNSLRSARGLGSRPLAARQWLPATPRAAVVLGQRTFADDKRPDVPKPPIIPPTETTTAAASKPPPPSSEAVVKSAVIPPNNVPLTPPAPPTASATPKATSGPVAAPTPAPKKRGFFRRLRNYILTISILGALAFGGGVWYSRVNDNFHDFFTEYVPYGEQAVLYLEEMDFRKRFPNISHRVDSKRPQDTGENVKIPAQSGASWRVADSAPPPTSSRSPALVPENASAKKVEAAKQGANKKEAPKEVTKAPEQPEKPVGGAVPVPVGEAQPAAKKTRRASTSSSGFKAPEVDEPSRWPPAAPIDPLKVNGATEPVVQELVRMLNDIITVINADKANEKYGATIGKAKNQLNQVARQIHDIKSAAEQSAADALKAKIETFDKAASDLISRVEGSMVAQEQHWRQQFEEEMQKLKSSYEERLKTMTERERQVNEEKLNNKLLQQAIDLSKQFSKDVKSHVEEERGGRLGKLGELSSAVSELERLTTSWNDVVDTNLRTQQLHVAVEAVRASLENAQHPRPFIKELVALKEIANQDAVVDAAIASINPTAYQRGISTSSELIDRFRRVAGEVRKASLLPEDAGVASHASSWVLSKVMFKKEGLAAGDDVESILTRTQTYLEEGDLDSAAREMNGLKGWAKTLSRDWLGEIRKVLEVQQAMEVIATEARLQSLKVE